MHLTHIDISNVRGFLDGPARTALDLPSAGAGWHVFAGRNGAGKSTLLRAIALAIVGPDHARHLVPSFAGWVRKGTTEAEVTVKIVRDEEDQCQGTGTLPKGPVPARLTWEASAPTAPFSGAEPRLASSPLRESKLKGPWRGSWAENPVGWLVAGYGPFRRLTGHAADAQRVMVGLNHQRRLVSLFREDASLLEAAGWLRELHHRKLDRREGAGVLLDGVLELLNDGLLPDGAKVDRVDSDGLWVRRGQTVIELQELSDGYRVALALVLDLVRHMHEAFGQVRFSHRGSVVRVESSAVALIDEIDAHLHVSWQQQIGFWLKDRFPNVQFLVTTHSPFICQAASEGGLFRLPTPGELKGVTPVSDETFRKVVYGDVNQAVLSELFGMDHTHSPKAVNMRTRYSQLEAKRLRGLLAPGERTELSKLTKQLPLDFPIPKAG